MHNNIVFDHPNTLGHYCAILSKFLQVSKLANIS